MAERRLVAVGTAADLLGVSDETVYRLARTRRIAYFRDPETGHWLFVAASIEAYLVANTVPARAPIAEVDPAPKKARGRRTASAGATRSAGDEPWRGTIFGPRDSAGGTTTRAASSAAQHRSTRPRDTKARESR